MYERVAAISLETVDGADGNSSIEWAGAAIVEHGRIASEYVSARSTAAREICEQLAAFVPAGVPCFCYEAEHVRGLLGRELGTPLGARFLDAAKLGSVLLPLLPDQAPETVCEDMDLAPDLHGVRSLVEIWNRLQDRVIALPLAVLEEINLLLVGRRDDLLRDFFARASREASGASPGERPPKLTDIFPETRLPRLRPAPAEERSIRPLDSDNVAGMLGRAGEFAALLPHYEHREGQVEAARAVCNAFNSEKHLLMEAGTGIGKSLAYLLPAVLWSTANQTPVIVSTNTKNLQSQLFEKDLPLIKRALAVDFSAALIKGRMNYLCVRKLLFLLRQAEQELDEHEVDDVLHVLGWAAATTTGDFAESSILDRPGNAGLRARLASSAEECAQRDCPHRRRCFLQHARAKAQNADIVVANHALVFAEININTSALPPYSDIVFDEAHNIEEAATRHFSVELSRSRLVFAIQRLWRRGRGRRGKGSGLLPALQRHLESSSFTGSAQQRTRAAGEADRLQRALPELEDGAVAFFEALRGFLPGREPQELIRLTPPLQASPAWGPVAQARAELAVVLEPLRQKVADLSRILQEVDEGKLPFHTDFIRGLTAVDVGLLEFQGDLEFILAADDRDFVYWVETSDPQGKTVRAWAAPVVVGQKLATALYEQKRTVVFCSATLTVKGKFDFLKQRLGISNLAEGRCLEMVAQSPFDYARQCMVMVPMFLPEPDQADRDYTTALGELLADVFRRTRGRGMALFTSYSMLRRATLVLNERLEGGPIRVLAQGASGSRENITSMFRRDLESVLMGTHSFWEGVDLVGETLSCLVIARLPFAVFTEPVQAARAERIELEGGSSFRDYALPNAVIRFRQGFGRLIRHRTDRGIVIVTDRRIMSKNYGAWFRGGLPVQPRAFQDRDQMLAALELFLAEVA